MVHILLIYGMYSTFIYMLKDKVLYSKRLLLFDYIYDLISAKWTRGEYQSPPVFYHQIPCGQRGQY